jgi:hypothetical protein
MQPCRMARMSDDDSGGVAGPNDEPTMAKGAQGSGRRPGPSRRDECAPRTPGIRVSAPRSAHPRGFHTTLDDGGGVPLFETQKLAEPSTVARGMSFLMQSTILEAVTTRLANQKAPADRQRHCGCAHKRRRSWRGWMCRSTQHISG